MGFEDRTLIGSDCTAPGHCTPFSFYLNIIYVTKNKNNPDSYCIFCIFQKTGRLCRFFPKCFVCYIMCIMHHALSQCI